jgi:hypothetical protein
MVLIFSLLLLHKFTTSFTSNFLSHSHTSKQIIRENTKRRLLCRLIKLTTYKMSGEKSNKRKADDFEKIEAQKAREKEVNAEMGRLISICGGLETHENIESAYDYHVMLGNSHEDVIKQDALAAYMSKYGPELERMNLMEMSLYRKIRRTSEFFLGVYLMEPETVAMLGITIDEWIWSEREGKLSEKHREIARQVEATGGSRAEMFRATMAQYKAEMEILGWDEDSLNLLRLSICQGRPQPVR